jgi:aspartate 1-decarboxylase
MDVFLLKSKIHRATVTGGEVNYSGSLTIAADLMEKCGLQAYEKNPLWQHGQRQSV